MRHVLCSVCDACLLYQLQPSETKLLLILKGSVKVFLMFGASAGCRSMPKDVIIIGDEKEFASYCISNKKELASCLFCSTKVNNKTLVCEACETIQRRPHPSWSSYENSCRGTYECPACEHETEVSLSATWFTCCSCGTPWHLSLKAE